MKDAQYERGWSAEAGGPAGEGEPLTTRLRRLRRTPGLRALVREARLDVDDLILPLFVTDGEDVR
jgi:delta-aminolevulinic acid dehydratase/porphobilinogen synthase